MAMSMQEIFGELPNVVTAHVQAAAELGTATSKTRQRRRSFALSPKSAAVVNSKARPIGETERNHSGE